MTNRSRNNVRMYVVIFNPSDKYIFEKVVLDMSCRSFFINISTNTIFNMCILKSLLKSFCIFHHLELELLTQFRAPNDEKYRMILRVILRGYRVLEWPGLPYSTCCKTQGNLITL